MGKNRITVNYVTSSEFKMEENRVFVEHCLLPDGSKVSEHFVFQFRKLPIREILEVDLVVMVQAEVATAYSQIKVPCIVEHAGLVFHDYKERSYPGGLTKPMWDTLKERFLEETNSAGRQVVARAAIAYCDGKNIRTFVGETEGKLANAPKGAREFYWDTVFVPNDPDAGGRTYAEIVETRELGLEYKVAKLSQSSRAMLKFLNFLLENPTSDLWR